MYLKCLTPSTVDAKTTLNVSSLGYGASSQSFVVFCMFFSFSSISLTLTLILMHLFTVNPNVSVPNVPVRQCTAASVANTYKSTVTYQSSNPYCTVS